MDEILTILANRAAEISVSAVDLLHIKMIQSIKYLVGRRGTRLETEARQAVGSEDGNQREIET
jgi:hypothetical protein